jgi:hypothetical protein
MGRVCHEPPPTNKEAVKTLKTYPALRKMQWDQMRLESRDLSTSLNFCRGMLCLRVSVQRGPRGRNRTGFQHKNKEIRTQTRQKSSEVLKSLFSRNIRFSSCLCWRPVLFLPRGPCCAPTRKQSIPLQKFSEVLKSLFSRNIGFSLFLCWSPVLFLPRGPCCALHANKASRGRNSAKC